MGQEKSFVKIFVSTTLVGILLVVSLGVVANPHGYWDLPVTLPCESVLNPTLEKYRLAENFSGMETLILGSSTSELFLPVDVQRLSDQKTFHGSVAGSQALNRLVLLRHTIAHQPSLKTVIYVADFFEWNDNIPTLFDPQVLKPSALRTLVPEKILRLSKFQFKNWMSTIFSFQVVEKSFKQIRHCLINAPEPFYDSVGNTPSTKALGSGSLDSELLAPESQERLDPWLTDKILESQVEYRRGAFLDFEFSPRVASIYQEIIKVAQENGLKIHFVLSPYHPQFLEAFHRDTVFSQGEFGDLYLQWRTTLTSMASQNGVEVWDFTTSEDYFPKTKNYWRDGVHYNHYGTAKLLNILFQDKEP